MKFLALAATLLALVGLGTVANACDAMKQTTASQSGDKAVWPDDKAS